MRERGIIDILFSVVLERLLSYAPDWVHSVLSALSLVLLVAVTALLGWAAWACWDDRQLRLFSLIFGGGAVMVMVVILVRVVFRK